MNVQRFGTTKVSILGLPFGNPVKKWHLDVVPTKRHIVYYREGSDASSQRLWVGWSLCLRLSLLSPLHHFHWTCIIRLFFGYVGWYHFKLCLVSSSYSHLRATTCPPTFEVLWVKDRAPNFFFRCFVLRPTTTTKMWCNLLA
jgi:hypothetical protein